MSTERLRTTAERPRRQFWPLVSALEGRPLMAPANVLVNNPALDSSQDTQSETSTLAYTNASGQHIVITAFNDSAVFGPGLHFTGWARSTDGGATFTDLSPLPDSTDGDAGDPILARDSVTGRIYLATLSFSGTSIQIFHSDNDGATFSAPVNAFPGVANPGFDKEWITVDNFPGPQQGTIYAGVYDYGENNGLFVTKSTDHGATWTSADGTEVASANAGNVQGINLVVGTDHSLYAFYYDGTSSPETIKVRRSTNQGASFGPAVTVTSLTTTGINGGLGLSPGFRSNSFPQGAVNPINGDIYVVYNTGGTHPGDKSDVFLRTSTNHGQTWGPAVRVNNDTGSTDQWQPTLAVTPDGAHIGIFWYDRRLDPADNLIGRFGAVATIANPSSPTSLPVVGANYEISDTTWAPSYGIDPVVNPTYMGDYDEAATDGSFFYNSWGDERLGNQDVREAKIAPVIHGPSVIATTPTGDQTAPIGNIRVTFNEPIPPAQNPNLLSQFVLTTTGSSEVISVSRVVPVQGSNNTQFIVWFSTPATGFGTFTVKIGPLIYDAAGYSMDENLNGVNGETPDDQFDSTFVFPPPPPPPVVYTDSAVTPNFTSIVGDPSAFTITPGVDDGSFLVSLPTGNTFNFYGTTYTSLYASSNGLISFGSPNSEYLNNDLTNDPTQAAIAPYWDDLYPGPGTPMLLGEFTTFNSAPALVIEWNQADHFPGTASGVTFEAILMLNTGSTAGDIYLEYGSLVFGDSSLDNGASATVGIKNAGNLPSTSNQRLLVSYDDNSNPLVQSNTAILFAPSGMSPRFSVRTATPTAPSPAPGGFVPTVGTTPTPVPIAAWTNPNGAPDARTGAFLNVRRKSR